MAWNQTDIDTLKAAIKNGQLEVRHGDTYVRYRSLDEMMKLLALMQGDVTTRSRGSVMAYRSIK